MTTMTLTNLHQHRNSRWNQVKISFTEWRRRARSRRELSHLSTMDLHDIGMSHCDAAGESSKPFWMA